MRRQDSSKKPLTDLEVWTAIYRRHVCGNVFQATPLSRELNRYLDEQAAVTRRFSPQNLRAWYNLALEGEYVPPIDRMFWLRNFHAHLGEVRAVGVKSLRGDVNPPHSQPTLEDGRANE